MSTFWKTNKKLLIPILIVAAVILIFALSNSLFKTEYSVNGNEIRYNGSMKSLAEKQPAFLRDIANGNFYLDGRLIHVITCGKYQITSSGGLVDIMESGVTVYKKGELVAYSTGGSERFIDNTILEIYDKGSQHHYYFKDIATAIKWMKTST